MKEKESGAIVLDRKICNDLRGIAILAVIAGHIFGGKFGFWESHTTAIFGTGAVNIFLILSGYGLFCSYKKSGLGGKKYWDKKIEKVFLPYAVVTVLYYFAFMRTNGVVLGVDRLIANVAGLDFRRGIDGTMWYISFLLLWYAAFFGAFYFEFPVFLKVALIWGVGYVFRSNLYQNVFQDCNWQFSTNAYAFPVGVTLGYGLELWNRFGGKKWRLRLGAAAKAVVCVCCFGLLTLGIFKRVELDYLQCGILGMGGFYFLLELMGKRIRVLEWIGSNSYFLYLIEGKLLGVLGRYAMLNENVWLYLAVYAGSIFAITWIWNWAWGKGMELAAQYEL